MNTILELVQTSPAHATEIPHSRPTIEAEDIEAVQRVLSSGMIAEGRLTSAFEEQLSTYVGAAGAVTAGSGTQALHLALLAADVRPGDRVAVPTYVCRAVLDACWAVGAQPVLVDSSEQYTIDPTRLAEIAGGCKAAIIPHIFGISANMEAIRQLGITIIEDCAQSIGGTYNGHPLGSFGDLAVFSFHAIKVITTAEGGAITSRSESLVERLRELKHNHSISIAPRWMYPLSDLQAALGISQIKRLDTFLDTRRRLAQNYLDGLSGIDAILPDQLASKTMFYRFPIRVPGGADTLISRFAEHHIAVRLPVCELLHRLLGLSSEEFPVAERLLHETLGLPIYPSLTDREQARIIASTRQLLRR